jgi:7-cyano-7-deazaguanine synthase
VNQTKAQIASWGAQLGVPFEDTWSCYKGGDYHCGRCGTCIERIEAFHIAGVKDPTVYQDMTMYLELRGKGKVR